MTLTQRNGSLYRIREIATQHLERDGQDQQQLLDELEAIAILAGAALEYGRGTIELRLAPANVEALMEGKRCHITYIRLGLGEDGVYELYIEGIGEAPLPLADWKPTVPLEARR